MKGQKMQDMKMKETLSMESGQCINTSVRTQVYSNGSFHLWIHM